MSIYACRSFALVSSLFGGFFGAVNSDAQSQSEVFNMSLEELNNVQVSIATGNAIRLDKAPSSASVISSVEIEAMGASTLNDILESVAGLHVSASSLSRLDSVYSIRGIHTGFNPQVLVMLNGVPIQYNLTGSRPTLFRMPANSIERVEVIRGPGSAIYGADAFAGVINVITKGYSKSSSEVGAKSGSFGGREFWLQSRTSIGDYNIAFNSSISQSEGDSSRIVSSDLQSILDVALGTQVSKAPGALSTRYSVVDSHLSVEGKSLTMNLTNWKSNDAGEGAGGAQAIDSMGRDDANLWIADLKYKLAESELFESIVKLNFSYFDEQAKFVLLPAGTLVPIGYDGNLDFAQPKGIVKFTDGLKGNPGGLAKDSQVEWVNQYSGFEKHKLRLALGSRFQNFEGREGKNFGPGVLDESSLPGGILPAAVDGTIIEITKDLNLYSDDASRRVRYVSLQDEWSISPSLNLTTGVRYDNYSDFGDTVNPRVGLVWAASPKFTTKFLYGEAFRAPSFSELYYKNNPVSLGEKKLNPERLNSSEISLIYQPTATLQGSLTLFDYRAKDMIDFVDSHEVGQTDTRIRRAKNAADQYGRGGELELIWNPSARLQIMSSVSIQNSENQNGEEIADAPQSQFKLGANYNLPNKWSVNLQMYRIGDRVRATGDARPVIDDYLLTNLTVKKRNLWNDVDLLLQIKNAFNEDAREPSSSSIANDFPLESRSVWIGVTYDFQ